MRYVFVSDIHGNYDKLIDALEKAQFNPCEDTLVNVGDSFDRGTQSLEVLDFLLELPQKILLWGNHDLYFFEALYFNRGFTESDVFNGVGATLSSFLGLPQKEKYEVADLNIMRIQLLENEDIKDKLLRYYLQCAFCAEWKDVVATHGWIPHNRKPYLNDKNQIAYDYSVPENWRKSNFYEWYDATSCRTDEILQSRQAFIEKPLIVGHWHAFDIAQQLLGEARYKDHFIDCSICEWNGYVFLDGTTILPEGKVNTFIKETDEVPTILWFDLKPFICPYKPM